MGVGVMRIHPYLVQTILIITITTKGNILFAVLTAAQVLTLYIYIWLNLKSIYLFSMEAPSHKTQENSPMIIKFDEMHEHCVKFHLNFT